MIRLTRHFEERWRERNDGPVPTEAELERMLDGAICIQEYRNTYTPRGVNLRIPALYWVPEKQLVIKVAEPWPGTQRTLITVLSESLQTRGNRKQRNDR